MDPFYITLLLSSPLLATLLPPLLLLIVPTKRMCFCVGKVLDKRVIALLSRNGQKMFPAQIVLLFQTSDFCTLSDRKRSPLPFFLSLFLPISTLSFPGVLFCCSKSNKVGLQCKLIFTGYRAKHMHSVISFILV